MLLVLQTQPVTYIPMSCVVAWCCSDVSKDQFHGAPLPAFESVSVQAFVSRLAVEAFNKRVSWLAYQAEEV